MVISIKFLKGFTMSTPTAQLLPAQDLRRIQNLRSKQEKTKASKNELVQYNRMKEEILQFMKIKKQKIKLVVNQHLTEQMHNKSLIAANDAFSALHFSQKNTYLVD